MNVKNIYILIVLILIIILAGGLLIWSNRTEKSPTESDNQGKKEIAENFIETSYYYKSYIKPLQFLASRKVNSDEDELLYSFKIKYGDGKEENRYPVIKIKNKEVVIARMFYNYSVDYMLNEFNSGKLLNPDCPYLVKEKCYKSFDMFVCGGSGATGCPDGYKCMITPCQTTDCEGICKPE